MGFFLLNIMIYGKLMRLKWYNMCIGIFINDCICLIKKIIIRSVFEKK